MSLHTANPDSRESRHAAREISDQASIPRCEIAPIEHMVDPDDRLTMAHDPYDPRCEKIRALRTELLLRRESVDRADIIALLSPCSGEGRSLLAAELAIAFAQTGRPTLLVDADLRRPQQHLFFGTDNRQGLSQAIEHGVKPQLHTVNGLPRMSVLTAGAVPSNPVELQQFRQHFIGGNTAVDGNAVVAVCGDHAVASLVGRVLALSRAQHTPYKDMQDMLRRLAATRSQILGAVISHF